MIDEKPALELLQVYERTLQTEIITKQHFLQQTKMAMQKLHEQETPLKSFPPSEWELFKKKAMFFPERSDPIGLSVASASLLSRKETSSEVLQDIELRQNKIDTLLVQQSHLNSILKDIIEKMENKLQNRNFDNATTPSVKDMNQQLWSNLREFVNNYLSVELNQNGTTDTSDREVWDILKRLVKYDPSLKVDDFYNSSAGLYRLLRKINLIDVSESNDGIKYVKLVDLATTDLA